MAIEGWYYLHTNGELIYNPELGGTAAYIQESSFARGLWPLDPSDRETGWRTLVEELAAGANKTCVLELAAEWGCDDADAEIYAERIGCNLFTDGKKWRATRRFIDLQGSPAGFGDTALEAMAALAVELGYKPSKIWGATFHDLLNTKRGTDHRDVPSYVPRSAQHQEGSKDNR
jgi:hypothetical protein